MSGTLLGQLDPNAIGLNPGMMGLLGAAGGFAQAAMPQPYKGGTPWGAALGMGAQGMGQGAQGAYGAQLNAARAQGQQIENQANASALPLTLAKNNLMTGVFQNPGILNQLMGSGNQSPTFTSSPQPAASLVAPALSSIADPNARSVAVNAALKAQLPQEAWAPWIASVHNESGWNLGQQDGKAGEIGPGQVMPDTAAGLTNPATGKPYTPQELRDPATNLTASAQYFGQKWQQSHGDPMMAATGYNTGDVAGNAPDYAGKVFQRLNAWGGASGQGQITADNAQNVYQAYQAKADALERQQSLFKFLGLPAPPGDPAMIRQAGLQVLKLGLAAPQAGAEEGARAGVQLATAGAIQRQKSLNENVDLRTGGMSGLVNAQGGRDWVKNPALVETQDAFGNTVPMHVSPALPGSPPGTPGEATPILGANNQPVVTKLPQQIQEQRDEAAKEFAGKEQDEYQAAQNTKGWLAQIDNAAKVMQQSGASYFTGPFAPQRYALMGRMNDLGRTIGIPDKALFNPDAIAFYEDMIKATTTAGFELASKYEGHSRQAASTIMNATGAIPGINNSPLGVIAVSSNIHEGANVATDLHEFKQLVNDKTQGAGLTSAETDYLKVHPPEQYSARAISNLNPIVLKKGDQPTNYLPGTFVTDGKTIDPATGKPKVIQIPERTETIGGIQFPMRIPQYIAGHALGQ